jgi:ribose transport system substrate-binding protein
MGVPRRRTLLVVLLCVLALIAAACGDDSAEPAPPPPAVAADEPDAAPPPDAPTAAAPADDAGLGEARALAEAAVAAPTSIGHSVQLSAAPPAGKNVAVVVCDLPPCSRVAGHVADAGALLGWNVEAYQFDGSPEDILEKFEFALSQGVDGIITSGVPRSAYETAAQTAIEQGVPIVTLSVPDAVAPPLISVISNEDTFNAIGKLLGAWVAADGGADSRAAIFILAPFDVHVSLGDGIKSELERLCDSCSGEIVNTQVTDIGTTIPSLSVSIVERSPETNYLIYADGSMAGGVVAALRDANLADAVKIGGMNPGPAELQAIMDGEQHVYLNLPEQWLAWSALDALVRHSVGDDPTAGMSATMPTQLMVAENVTSTDPPLGAVNQEEQFKTLWRVGEQAAVDPGLEEARLLAESALAEPTSIGIDVPLSSKPNEGKHIAVVVCDAPTCTRAIQNVTAAADLLGWTVEGVQFDGSPEDILDKMEYAISLAPDGIVTTGVPRSAFETAAETAADLGIPMAACCIPDELDDPFVSIINNKETFYKIGQILGAWVAADGGANSHAAMAILAPFPVHVSLGDGFKHELERLCDTCSAEILNTQISDIGTTIPSLSASVIERNPDVNYLMYADGVMATGVVAALRDANLADAVKIGGMNPGPPELQAIIDGEQHTYLNLPEPWIALMMIDALARHFNGEDPTVGMNATMPIRLVNQGNVTGTENPAGAVNQEEQFKALWLVD